MFLMIIGKMSTYIVFIITHVIKVYYDLFEKLSFDHFTICLIRKIDENIVIVVIRRIS